MLGDVLHVLNVAEHGDSFENDSEQLRKRHASRPHATPEGMIAAGVRRAACRHHVERGKRGEDSPAERCYRELIFFAGRGVAAVV